MIYRTECRARCNAWFIPRCRDGCGSVCGSWCSEGVVIGGEAWCKALCSA